MHANIKDLTWKRFWKLLVIKMLEEKWNRWQIRYESICDCGKKHITSGESIRSGKSKSCWCNRLTPPNKSIDREHAIWHQLYKSTIIKRSKKNCIKSDIWFSRFVEISKEKCHYCGLENSNFATDRLNTKKWGKTSDTIIKYNGIDRVDSNNWYTWNNIVPCCKYCNVAKSTMTDDEFKIWIQRIYCYYIK